MSNLIWPRRLPAGGTIGICSPAGPSTKGAISRAVAALERRGYNVVVAHHAEAVHPDYPYLAGTTSQRLSDLNGLICNPEIDLILAARGGYGAGKLLGGIDYDALRADPKALVGYSDITALNLAIAAKAGVVSYSGIMATAGDGFGEDTLDPFSEASFFYAVAGEIAPLVFQQPDDAPLVLHRGPNRIAGPLYPVCLSLLESLASTAYVPSLRGAILLVEDVYEELYAVDRALNQLRLSGVLSQVAAVLIGSFNGFKDERDAALAVGVPKLALDMTSAAAVVSGVVYGHIPRRFTLPVGALAEVDVASRMITVQR